MVTLLQDAAPAAEQQRLHARGPEVRIRLAERLIHVQVGLPPGWGLVHEAL